MFFYTSDMKYMMKTIPEREFESFYYVLQNYYEHIQTNKNSLITRFFGLHQLSISNQESEFQKPVYLVSMENIFGDFNVTWRFDLKGSTANRQTLKGKM
jgi:1-phosphatidylinositol-4-phosphate 5-kinase